MFLIGVTGGLGSGKSTVSTLFSKHCHPVLDADLISREVVARGSQGLKEVINAFGVHVLDENGDLNRKKLASIVFSDDIQRRRLQAIVWPKVYKHMLKKIIYYFFTGKQFVVLDLPLLYESNRMTSLFHKILVVSCSVDQQIERVLLRDEMSLDEIKQRIAAQMPLQEKCRRADIIIDNSLDRENTAKQVIVMMKQLESSHFHWLIRGIFFLTLSVFTIPVIYLWKVFHSFF